MRIALAALNGAGTVAHGVRKIVEAISDCGHRDVQLVCTPEAYLPGLRGGDFELPDPDQAAIDAGVERISVACREHAVAAIVGMEWQTERGLENRAVVFSRDGELLGYQAKIQVTPGGEEETYVAGEKRRVFTVDGVTFGISICHEAWRYPETVRWATVQGAQIVFIPHVTGNDTSGQVLAQWGDAFYEKAMQCRAAENTCFIAAVNQAMRYQKSATSIIAPDGAVIDWVPYGAECLLHADLPMEKATLRYAKRFRPDAYPG